MKETISATLFVFLITLVCFSCKKDEPETEPEILKPKIVSVKYAVYENGVSASKMTFTFDVPVGSADTVMHTISDTLILKEGYFYSIETEFFTANGKLVNNKAAPYYFEVICIAPNIDDSVVYASGPGDGLPENEGKYIKGALVLIDTIERDKPYPKNITHDFGMYLRKDPTQPMASLIKVSLPVKVTE